MAETEQNPRKRLNLVWISIAVAAIAAAVPVFWFAAVLLVGIASFIVSGRLRWLVVTLGGVLMAIACVRFALEHAKPNLKAETVEVEKEALSKIREIYWAQAQARQFKLVDTNGDGVGEYLSLPELIGEQTSRLREQKPLLKPGVFHLVDAERGIYEAERYLFMVYLPAVDGSVTTRADKADADAAGRSFAAYAWPIDAERGKHKAFYVDQFEQICESDRFAGTAVLPSPSAYALHAREGVSICGQDETSELWRPWKGRSGRAKEPRATR